MGLVECNGVGYKVRISLHTYSRLQGKKQVKIYTYLLVREDAQLLYGFHDLQEQGLFEQLISISGVGANTAITILSSMPPEDLFQAIRTGDAFTLTRIKGIGSKTAGRILLELKDKISLEGEASAAAPMGQLKEEALAALAQLGFPRAAMEKRLDKLFKENDGQLSVEEVIKLALRNN